MAVWLSCTAMVRADALVAFKEGQKVEVREGDTWSPANVVKQEGRRYLIHYEGAAASTDEWVALDRIRLPGTGRAEPAKVIPRWVSGDKIEYKSGPFWGKGSIVNKRGGWYFVEKEGWKQREWVEYWRIRNLGATEDEIGNADSWGQVRNGEGPPRQDPGDPPAKNESTKDVIKRQLLAASDAKYPTTQISRDKLAEMAIDADANAPFVPDADLKPKPLFSKPIAMAGATGVFAEHVEQTFFSSGDAAILLAVHRADETQRLDRLDLSAGRSLGAPALPPGRTPRDLSPDGNLLLTLNQSEHLERPDRLDVWNIEGADIKQLISFRPFAGSTRDEHGIEWARFVAGNNVAVLSGEGRLMVLGPKGNALWAIGIEQFGQALALSANRKQIAFFSEQAIAILDTQSGKTLRVLRDPIKNRQVRALAFKPDGKQVAEAGQELLLVYDIDGGRVKNELYPDIPQPALQQVDRGIGFLSEGYVLTYGSWTGGEHNIIGLEQQMTVWRIGGKAPYGTHVAGVFGGRFWYVAPPAHGGKPVLISSALPDKDMLAALNGLNLSKEMAVHPGMSVSLDVNLPDQTRDKVIAHLKAALQANGVSVADNQPIKLAATTEQGQSREMAYAPWMLAHLPGNTKNVTRVTVNDLIYRISFVGSDGRKIWEHSATHVPPASIRLKKDQAVEDAVREAMTPSDGFFATLTIPKLIPKDSTGAGFGESELTGLGLKIVAK
jgi:hypothetical protein